MLGELARRYAPRGLRDRSPRPLEARWLVGSRGAHLRRQPRPRAAAAGCRGSRARIRPWPTARAALGTSCSISMPRTLSAARLRLEDKGPIQALHWREAVDQEAAREAARADRRAGRGRGPRAPLGAQGARAPPRRRHRQGHGGRAPAGRGLGRARPVRRRRPHRPRRVRGAARAGERGAAARLLSASASPPTRPRRSSRSAPTWWSTGPTAFLEVLRALAAGRGATDAVRRPPAPDRAPDRGRGHRRWGS